MNQQNKRCTDKLFTRKKASFRVATMLSLCLLLLWGSTCFAQGTTSVLSGIVFDPQGRVVSNATVTLISDDKGTQWTAKTNEAGSWRVNALVAGRYHFSVSAPGFARVEHSSFFLEMGTQRNLDSTLQLGASTEKITVTAEEPLIDTSDAVSGTVLDAKHLDELPTHTNSPMEFLVATPGFTFGSYQSLTLCTQFIFAHLKFLLDKPYCACYVVRLDKKTPPEVNRFSMLATFSFI